jgi:hypothetical protein
MHSAIELNMSIILRINGWFILSMLTTVILAQNPEGIQIVEYTPEFSFRDGLYLSVEMVKANHPVPLSRIVSDYNKYNKEFFDDLIAQEKVIFYDENGVETPILIKETWGYVLNGKIYLMLGSKFQRISIEGAISLFVATATTYERIPLSRDDDLYPVRTPTYVGSSYRYISSYVTVKSRRYLFDFESNTLSGYHSEDLEELLKRDLELYSEYRSLPKRRKNRMMLTYIRRYNEKHPLYFPVK